MGSFLSVAAGSDEPLKFLQVHYKGADSATAPIAIVGKGVTFDRFTTLTHSTITTLTHSLHHYIISLLNQ